MASPGRRIVLPFRKSKVIDIMEDLRKCIVVADGRDPWVVSKDRRGNSGSDCLTTAPDTVASDGMLHAVGPSRFAQTGAAAIRRFGSEGAVLYDVKGIFAEHETDGRL